jgi:hypothetical protein
MMSPQMVELFLRSAGAPPAVLSLVKLITAEGFGKFALKRMDPTDPAWAHVDAQPDKPKTGLWMRAESKQTRVTIAVFLEGENDKVLAALQGIGGTGVSARNNGLPSSI